MVVCRKILLSDEELTRGGRYTGANRKELQSPGAGVEGILWRSLKDELEGNSSTGESEDPG